MPFLCHKNTYVALAENKTVKNHHCPSPVWAAQVQAEEFSANASVQNSTLARSPPSPSGGIPYFLGTISPWVHGESYGLPAWVPWLSPKRFSPKEARERSLLLSPFNPERFHSDLGGGRQAQPGGTGVFSGEGREGPRTAGRITLHPAQLELEKGICP